MVGEEEGDRHVFLFRHCVRSTKISVKIGPLDDGTYKEIPVSDLLANPSPEWNVPEEWCTEAGMAAMQATGEYLAFDTLSLGGKNYNHNQSKNHNHTNANMSVSNGGRAHKIRFEFVTDTSQRDVDTAFALKEGMTKVLSEVTGTSGIAAADASNLSELRYDEALFNPTDDGEGGQFPNLCHVNYTEERLADDRLRRKSLVSEPGQSNDSGGGRGLQKALHSLEAMGGVGPAGPLHLLPGGEDSQLKALKVLSQELFYSRASDIRPPFLPNVTVDEIYDYVAWIHYARSVESVDNVASAVHGVVAARAMLEALRSNKNVSDNKSTSASTTVVTVLVGHDSNLDAVATALGVSWKLGPPFVDQDGLLPTPPGSGIHLVRRAGDNTVRMSYLYPVMVQPKPKKKHNSYNYFFDGTGVLESVPLYWLEDDYDYDTHYNRTGNDTKIFEPPVVDATGQFSFTTMDTLERRMQLTLSRYPEAHDCHSAAYRRYHHREDLLNTYTLGVEIQKVKTFYRTAILILIFIPAILLLRCIFKKRKHGKDMNVFNDAFSPNLDNSIL